MHEIWQGSKTPSVHVEYGVDGVEHALSTVYQNYYNQLCELDED